ncbi:hypothetical protein COOONC_16876 [Cooperia oncophora]
MQFPSFSSCIYFQQVLAFTTVHGCVSVAQAIANVRRCQRAGKCARDFLRRRSFLLKRKYFHGRGFLSSEFQILIPVYKGSQEPIVGEKPPYSESIFFGKDGIGDDPKAFPEVLEQDFKPTSEEVATLALIRLAKEHPTATLVCLGPLTNVALALKIDPSFTFKRVVIMGGNYYGNILFWVIL